MKKIRIGNDVAIRWRITIGGEAVSLEGLDLSLYISSAYQPRKELTCVVTGNEVTATFPGAVQTQTGVYKLSLYRNEGENGQTIVDTCDAFELVACSCQTVDVGFGTAEVELPVADMGIGVPGLSAYEVAVMEGFRGTQAEWVLSLSADSKEAAAECREVIAEFSQAEGGRVTAEAQRVINENSRITGEESRGEAENNRAAAEQLRAAAESKRDTAELARIASENNRANAEDARSSAEAIRVANENTRLADEETRAQNETARATAESKRANAEAQRETAEADRRAAEQGRIGNENTRQTAEQDRMNAEANRVGAENLRKTAEEARQTNEATRQTNEAARVTAETNRESAETDRADAEAARVEAEQARAEEFATFTATLAAKEDVANKVTSINADADDVHYPSAKAVWSAIKGNIGNTEGGNSEIIDSIYNQLTDTYTYGNTDVTTAVQRIQQCWVYNEALNSSRTISKVTISTDYSGEAQIVIVDGSTNSVLRTHSIVLSGRETDVSSYKIKVNAGERFGLACNTFVVGYYNSATGYKAGYLNKYPISVGDNIATQKYCIDVVFTFTDYIDIKGLKDVGYDRQEYTDFPLKGFYRNDTGVFVLNGEFLASELIEINQPTIVEFNTSVSVNNQSYISPVIKFNADKIITGIVKNGDLITEKSYVAYSCHREAKSFYLKKFSPTWSGGDSSTVGFSLNSYLVDGSYLTETNKEYPNRGFCKSVYIKVYEGDIVYNNYKTDAASPILVYDEQKNFIKAASSVYTVENNGFIRISFAWKYYSSTFDPDTYSEVKISRSKEKYEIGRDKQFHTLNAIPYNELTDVPETAEIASSASNAFINLKNIEYKKADMATTIENIGRAYLFENKDTGNLELRIVKDSNTIVGCELSVKKTTQKSIASKSFSMVHFGDSITAGVGSDEGKHYTDVIKNSLISYGHTITGQVNKGISGEYCESYYYKVLNYDKEHFDIATLMIGVNDRDRWYTVKGGTYEQFAEFRKWYRKYLRLLISAIFSYCTPKRLYLISPYYYRDQLFTDITIDECIYAARDLENVHLCRGDIYIQNGELGGLHVNNEGALLLGTEVAKEMAPDISTISDL